MAIPMGYSASSTENLAQDNTAGLKNASGTGFRGANVSFAVGRGASAKADGSAGSVPVYVWVAAFLLAGWVIWKKM